MENRVSLSASLALVSDSQKQNTLSKSETAMDDTTLDIPLGLEALDRGSIRVCIVTGIWSLAFS